MGRAQGCSIRATSSRAHRQLANKQVGAAFLQAPRPGGMLSPAASDTTPDAAPDAADSVCAGPAAASALTFVLPLLPPDAWICAAATCRAWRAAVAVAPGRWAVLDFRGCAVVVNGSALVTLCTRAGGALRELRLDAPACNSLCLASVVDALEKGCCAGLRRYTPPLTCSREQWSPFGEYAHSPYGIKPGYACALAYACPALQYAACRVKAQYVRDVHDVGSVLPGPLTLVFLRGWRLSQVFKTLPLHRSVAALDACSAHWGNQGAAVVAKALSEDGGSGVVSVDLSFNEIDNAGVRSLAEMLRTNTTLKDLNLRHNYFYDDGATTLCDALRVNVSLSRLVLTSNCIGDVGAASLAEALHMNTGITELQLASTSIGFAGAKALAQALIVNRTLTSLTWGSIRKSEMLALLKLLVCCK